MLRRKWKMSWYLLFVYSTNQRVCRWM
jgi:hypothetical protein